jgi:hypothetical protein
VHKWLWLYAGDLGWVRQVTVPDNVVLIHSKGEACWKAHEVVLGPRVSIKDWLAEKPEVSIAAATYNPWAIRRWLPPDLITAEVVMAAVKSEGSVLEDVPSGLRTAEVCDAAVSQTGRRALGAVPPDLITPELCLRAVRNNAYELLDVPPSMRTYDVCLAAMIAHKQRTVGQPEADVVFNRGLLFDFVPRELRERIAEAFDEKCA